MYLEKLMDAVLTLVACEEQMNSVDLNPNLANVIKAKGVLYDARKKIDDMREQLEAIKYEHQKKKTVS